MITTRGVGIDPITTCPHCSRLVNGTCEICVDGDPHPSCHMCVNGQLKMPWYRNELVIAVGTTIVVTVASAIILAAIQKKIGKKLT
jgi:hypothetical protein